MCAWTSSFPTAELFWDFATEPLQVLPCSFVTFHPPFSVLLRNINASVETPHHADTKLKKKKCIDVSLEALTTSDENAVTYKQLVLFDMKFP